MATPTLLHGARLRENSIDQAKLTAEIRTMLSEIADKANTADLIGGDNKLLTSLLPDSVVGGMKYKGVWDAATNTPAIPAASASNAGFYYKVSVNGTTAIDGIAEWAVGDWLVSNGTSWDKIDNSEKTEEALTTHFDNTVKNLLQATNVQGAVDELAENANHREIYAKFAIKGNLKSSFWVGNTINGKLISAGDLAFVPNENAIYVAAPDSASASNLALASSPNQIDFGVNIVTTTYRLGLVLAGTYFVYKNASSSKSYFVSNSEANGINFLDPRSGSFVSVASVLAELTSNASLAARLVKRAALTGTADGINAVFTLVGQKLVADTDEVFVDGMLQEPGTDADYVLTVSGADTVVTFNAGAIPSAGSRVRISGVKA